MKKLLVLFVMSLTACAGVDAEMESVDEADECVFCDDRADAFGISRSSYLAYGIVDLANNASEQVLDIDVSLDARAARGIVANRPFDFIEEVDTVPYVGRVAFANMATYVQANNLLAYCGDGVVQSLIETCDDGNNVDGDGCSSICQFEATNHAILAARPELISGAEMGVPQVDPQAFYFRSRSYKPQYNNAELTFKGSQELLALLRRAETIQAGNGEDGVVTWDDLAIMSKSPFYDALLPAEKVTLGHAWKMFKLSEAPIVEIDYAGPRLTSIPTRENIVRPGRLVVPAFRRVADLDNSPIAQRIQGVPALNKDGDPSTVHFDDVRNAREHYQPIFTASESQQLENLHHEFFVGTKPEQGGEFTVEFDAAPDQGLVTEPIVSFDGWEFSYETWHTVRYFAEDITGTHGLSAKGSLIQEYARRAVLTRNGESKLNCWSGEFSDCDTRFDYDGVRYYRLDGTVVRAGGATGLVVMELWENGVPTYSRVVDFKRKLGGVAFWPRGGVGRLFMAEPRFGQQPLSLKKEGADFVLTTGPGLATGVDTMLLNYISKVKTRLPAGRYEEFEGVVLDVLESGAVIARFDGCVLPTRINHNYLVTDPCPASGRRVTISFSYETSLWVYMTESDRREITIDDDGQYGVLRRDRTYSVVR